MAYYNSYLLDELHRLFPAILYDQTQFQNNELVQYIRSRVRDVYNLYDAASNEYARRAPQQQRPESANTFSPSSSTGSLQEQVRLRAQPRGPYRRRNRRNAIYSGWNSYDEGQAPPLRRNTPNLSPRTTPTSSTQSSPQEPRAPQFTVRSFLDSATAAPAPAPANEQELSADTLTAILGLLSLPTAGMMPTTQRIATNPMGNASIYATPILQYPAAATHYSYFGTPTANAAQQHRQDQSWAEILASFMNPVPVRPTQEQIERATRLFLTDVSTARESCVICFDTISDGQAQREIRECGHSFHRDCIDRHFQTSPRCPLCRHDIRTAPAAAAAVEVQPSGGE
jgi:hypothetical protein